MSFTPEILTSFNLNSLPNNVEEHLSLLNGHSRLTDLDSLIYVIHKSTNKKPVQVDLAYQHPTEEKKTRKYVEDDSDSDDDSNIVQIQPKKCFPSRSRPQNIDSASSSRYKRQKIASDSGSSFSNDSELPSIETLSASQMPPSTSANYESHNTRFKSTKIPGIQAASAKPNPRIPVSNVIPNSKAVVHKNSDEWASSGISLLLSTSTGTSISISKQHHKHQRQPQQVLEHHLESGTAASTGINQHIRGHIILSTNIYADTSSYQLSTDGTSTQTPKEHQLNTEGSSGQLGGTSRKIIRYNK
ncbi:hypothetical protein PSHT_08417 [Puccinia striiformis]|uniref:Uncharacterized protein n=1 Tax=Puccinia striiformis TaxID=27350 RepID=A0A2S4VPT5_9BASI|nr:hypothetical protein PSHT_08417 [Puccinia striiformis]